MPVRPRPGRRIETYYGGALLIFFCYIIRINLCSRGNDASVECFSAREAPAFRTTSRSFEGRFDRLSIDMTSQLPFFAESITEDEDDEYAIFEEELLGNNIEQRIVERNQKRNEHNSINQDNAFEYMPWDLMSLSEETFSEETSSDETEEEEDDEEDERLLSDEQARALALIKEGQNVFLTGVAGTGKSLVLKKALEYIKETYDEKEYVAVAPTGSTAIVLEGQTVHSFAGIGIPKVYTDFRKMKSNKRIKTRWENLKVLVVDEVSMISGEFFDSLSTIVSDIRNDPRPFGGIQLIVCGDFLQLSPITPRKWEVDQMVNGIREKEGLQTVQEARNWLFLNRGFCFQSEAWKASNFEMIELKHVFRQSNRDFVNILQNIRLGNVTSETVQYLRENCERPLPQNDFGVQPTILHSKNVNVDKENLVDLGKLSGDTVTFEAFDEVEREKGVGKWVEKDLERNSFFKSCTADKYLRLKIGAQVMLVKNLGQNSMLTNGSRGTVVGFRKVKRSGDTKLLPGVDKYPVVRFKNGLQLVVTPQKFQSRILGMGTCTRTAIPLKLAWAITTHKAQGMTLDYVIADVGQVFAEAQLYVALSRVSDETGLELRNFSSNRVRANPLALRFHKDPSKQYPFWWDLDGSKPKIMNEGTKSKRKITNKERRENVSSSSSATEHIITDKYSETVMDKQVLQMRTIVELKQMLRERGLKVSGRKAELIERLTPSSFSPVSKKVPQRTYSESAMDKQVLQMRTVVELKQMLRERGLKVSGRKAELIERLTPSSLSLASKQKAQKTSSATALEKQVLQKRTVVELKQILRERHLKVSGRKAELIDRLVSMSR